jgi:hypothetical protein
MPAKPQAPDHRCPISLRSQLEEAIRRSKNQQEKATIRPRDQIEVVVPTHPLLRRTVSPDLVGRRGRVASPVYSGVRTMKNQNFHQVRVDGEVEDRELPLQALSAT